MESKFRKTSKNLIFQLLYQVINLVLGLIVPSLVIKTYGSEVNGLTSTVKQLITLVTLAKAGISTAATFSMYKLVNEVDKGKIAQVLNAVKKTFLKISAIVLLVGITSSIVFAIVQTGALAKQYVFLACFLFCLNAVIDIAFTMHFNVFFSATQDKYYISIGLLISTLVMYGIQFLVIFTKSHFVLLYSASVFGVIIKIAFLSVIYKKKYAPYKLSKQEQEKVNGEKVRLFGVGYATLNEVAHCAVTATQTIILAIMCGFKEASVYGVYLMVIDALLLVGQVFYTSFSPSYCSIIAEGNVKRVNYVFSIFQYAYYLLNTFMFMCATLLLMPFVKVYTIGVVDIDYENYVLAFGMILYGLFSAYRIPYNITVSGVGAFKKAGIQTSITSIISILVSIIAVQINYALIIIGPILFYVVNTFYQHFMLKKEFVGFDNSGFERSFFTSVICIILSMVGGFYLEKIYAPNNYFQWGVLAIIMAIISLVILLVISFILNRKNMINTFIFFKSKVRKGQ